MGGTIIFLVNMNVSPTIKATTMRGENTASVNDWTVAFIMTKKKKRERKRAGLLLCKTGIFFVLFRSAGMSMRCSWKENANPKKKEIFVGRDFEFAREWCSSLFWSVRRFTF